MTPLSPLHLGTGQDYEPSGYVIDDETLWEFDALAAQHVLSEAEQSRLGRLLDGRVDDSMLRQVQAFFYENRERLVSVSRHQVRVPQRVEEFYQERVGKFGQQEGRGSGLQNRLEIERTAWSSGTGQAIVPGSGVKGAIRTALLDAVRSGKRDLKTSGSLGKWNELQWRLLEYEPGRFEKDPMRMVSLSDATLARPDDFVTEVRFALNRKKHRVVKNGRLLESRAEQAGLYQLLECIPPWKARALDGALSIQNRGNVESGHWPKLRFSLLEMATACNRFYRAHLDRELAILREMEYLDPKWDERLSKLLAGPVGRALEQNQAFLVRVGRHSGAESITLNEIRSIKIMKGKGGEHEFLDSPKTLWLAGDERQARHNLLPFGWLLVEPFRDEAQLPEWADTGSDESTHDWRARIRERKDRLKERFEADRRSLESQRREAEAAQRKAAEEAARLSAMGPEERQIQDLRDTLDRELRAGKGKLSPSGQVANARVTLLRAAQGWEAPLRHRAADAIEATLEHLHWPKQKESERTAELNRLRRQE